MLGIVGRILALKFSFVIPRTVNMLRYCAHEYITLYWQRDFVFVIKVDLQLTLKQGGWPRLSWWAQSMLSQESLRAKTSLDYPGGPRVVTWVFKSRQRQKWGKVQWNKSERAREWEVFHALLLALKIQGPREEENRLPLETKNELLPKASHAQNWILPTS